MFWGKYTFAKAKETLRSAPSGAYIVWTYIDIHNVFISTHATIGSDVVNVAWKVYADGFTSFKHDIVVSGGPTELARYLKGDADDAAFVPSPAALAEREETTQLLCKEANALFNVDCVALDVARIVMPWAGFEEEEEEAAATYSHPEPPMCD
jgi:hypothetical protein